MKRQSKAKIEVDNFPDVCKICCVQARGGLAETHAERRSFRIPIRFAATSRGRSARLCVSAQHHPEKVIRSRAEQSVAGEFYPRLSRETASRDMSCRNMTGLAGCTAAGARVRVREDIKTHRPTEKENVSPLIASIGKLAALKPEGPSVSRSIENGTLVTCRVAGQWKHSRDCGFLSPFAFFQSPQVGGKGGSFLSLFLLLYPSGRALRAYVPFPGFSRL